MADRPRRHAWRRAALIVVAAVLANGCAGYRLEGRVVSGDYSTMAFVPGDDARLVGAGVSSVEVSIFRDPTRPNATLVARELTDADGRFSLPLDAFGAGWMIERWRIVAARPGYQTAELLLELPAASERRRLLVILAPGFTPSTGDEEDLMQLYERFR